MTRIIIVSRSKRSETTKLMISGLARTWSLQAPIDISRRPGSSGNSWSAEFCQHQKQESWSKSDIFHRLVYFSPEVRPSTKNLPDFLENPENSSTRRSFILPSVPDYFENPENPIEFWCTQESHSLKCTRLFRKSRENYKILVHPGTSFSKVYQIISKI